MYYKSISTRVSCTYSFAVLSRFVFSVGEGRCYPAMADKKEGGSWLPP